MGKTSPPTGVAAPKYPERTKKPIGKWDKPIGTKLMSVKARVQKLVCAKPVYKARMQKFVYKALVKMILAPDPPTVGGCSYKCLVLFKIFL